MKEEKDERLIEIYIKIHNKRDITMDDLAYLARYNPTCFKKTCDKLLNRVPEAKALVKEPAEETVMPRGKQIERETPVEAGRYFNKTAGGTIQDEQMVRQFIENLKKYETSEMNPMQGINVTEVKELLGDLFMENLVIKEEIQGYFDAYQGKNSVINVRV